MVHTISSEYSPELGVISLTTRNSHTSTETLPARTAVRDLHFRTLVSGGLAVTALGTYLTSIILGINSGFDALVGTHVAKDYLGNFGGLLDMNPAFSAALLAGTTYGSFKLGLYAGKECDRDRLKLSVARSVILPTLRRQARIKK